jgi:hypothetical protein
MIQEEKQILLQDLCGRLPYGVCVHIRYKEGEPCYGKLTPRDIQWVIDSNIEDIKPYLRPMSSMTAEEKIEYRNIAPGIEWNYGIQFPTTNKIDWLNAHHFDYRGLIEKGIALEAPEGMYNIKEKQL